MRFFLMTKDKPQTRINNRETDLAATQPWADNDPYAKAGLFGEVTLQAWKKIVI